MDPQRPRVRLRQVVLAAAELAPAVSELQQQLGLREPYRDPGVAEFGIRNAVFEVGSGFLEVVSPAQAGSAAGRFLERGGDGGYMVIFDLEDLAGARRRVQELGIRVVWQIDLDDISGTHLHPADIGGTIVSLDRSRPFGTWRWGGPRWTGRTGTGASGRLAAITVAVAVAEPSTTAARWAAVLGVSVNGTTIDLDDGEVRFVAAPTGSRQGLVEIDLELPASLRQARPAIEVAGTRLRLLVQT